MTVTQLSLQFLGSLYLLSMRRTDNLDVARLIVALVDPTMRTVISAVANLARLPHKIRLYYQILLFDVV